jgi:O-antigen ligase
MAGVSLSFPSYALVSKFVIAFAIVGLFFMNKWSIKKQLLQTHKYAFLSISFLFLLTLLGSIYTDNFQDVPTSIVQKLPFLIIPLVIFSIPLHKDTFDKMHQYFSYGVVASSLSALLKALYFKYKHLGDYLYYHQFSIFTEKHSTYYAIFLVLAFIYFYKMLISTQKNRWTNLLLLVFLLIMLYIISNRISMLALFVALLTITFPRLNLKAKIGFLLLALLGLVLAVNTPYIKKRFSASHLKSTQQSEITLRKAHWKSAIETIFENNILIGAGTEGNRHKLYEKYKKYNYKDAYVFKYNAHNQMLETGLDFGILGMLLLLIAFIYQFRLIIKHKNYYFLAVYLSLLSFSLTESIFERQSGIIVFSLFVSVILAILFKSKSTNYENNAI